MRELIDLAGTALPHREVAVVDYYKHIAGEGLSEPRRMKQLLVWCGTRALDDRPLHSPADDSGSEAGEDPFQP